MMGSSRSAEENEYFPYVNTQQLAYVVEVFPELNDQLDTPSGDFLDTFRLRTGEAVYSTKKQNDDVETLNIRDVEIVTYWSKDMNAVTTRFCSGKNDKDVCNAHPLCRFRNDKCTENQLKVIVEYVFTQLDNMFTYLDIEEKNFNRWDDIVKCWLWNGIINPGIDVEKYEKLENVMTEVGKENYDYLPDAYSNLLRSAYEIVQNMPKYAFDDDEDKPSDEYLLAKVLNIEQDELFQLPDAGDSVWNVNNGDVVIVKSDGDKYRAISNLDDNSQFQAMKLFNTGIVQAKIKEDTSVSKKRKASSQGGRTRNV